MSASVPILDLPGSRSSSHMGQHSASIPKMPGSMTSNNNTSDEDDDTLTFDSPQEEAAHYREKYRRILDTLDETRAELGELKGSSSQTTVRHRTAGDKSWYGRAATNGRGIPAIQQRA